MHGTFSTHDLLQNLARSVGRVCAAVRAARDATCLWARLRQGRRSRLLTTGTCRKLLSIMSSMAARTVSSGVTVFSTLSGVMISSTLSVALLLPDTTTFVR